MGEILQNWIQARLGIMIDLVPEIFGRYTRDGKLLAEILHSYDIINREQLNTIVDTQDPALCRVNLKHLGVWLRFLGVECDDESAEEISCGKGSAALRLFYKVYLCLETKDRLHFVTLQKEREKFVPASKKFEVVAISEDPPPYKPPRHPLSRKLERGKDVVDWHRSQYPLLLRTTNRERDRTACSVVAESVKRVVPEVRFSQDLPSCAPDAWKEESAEADRFARAHRVRGRRERERGEDSDSVSDSDSDAVAGRAVGVDPARDRGRFAASKRREQTALLSVVREGVAEEQERAFDEAIARRVLDRSEYEKRIATKLIEVREQRYAMAENKRILEDAIAETNEAEHRGNLERESDAISERRKDVAAEHRRMRELRQRLREEKIRKIAEERERICRETAEDMADLALRIAIYRGANDGHVPRTVLRKWVTLFLGCQPIFEVEGAADEEKLERVEALREALFEDYLERNSPWDEFFPPLAEDARETFELSRAVLGRVAHRLLNYARFESTNDGSRAPFPKWRIAAVVLGVTSATARETLRSLLERSNVRSVRVEDAINYCLERYKSEESDAERVDSRAIAATEEIVNRLRKRERGVSRDASPTSGRSGRSERSEMVEEGEPKTPEKETQSPRNASRDGSDPALSDAAYIGKRTYEFLVLGEPITDELATNVLTEYLRSLTDATGWVLLDYPETYEQMSLLETALTGSTLPANPASLDFEEDVTVEDVRSVPPRIVFENPLDPSTLYRRSKIVPDRIERPTEDLSTAAFVTLFVRVARKPRNSDIEERSYETVNPDTPAVDEFYASRSVAYLLYCSTVDSTVAKVLARLLTGESTTSEPSEENRGKEHRGGTGSRAAPVLRRLVTEPIDATPAEEEEEEEEEQEPLDDDSPATNSDRRPARPGEAAWQWVDLPLPSGLVRYLANLWQGLEKAYVENLKELLFLKSVHSSEVVAYRALVTKGATEFVDRPHVMQDLLHDFHRAFNAVEKDARSDADVKCELHRRVADFQARLWEICDRRRLESEEERKRFARDGWTVDEAVTLFDVYVGVVQVETDRCVDSIRLLQDYYLGMSRKPLQETRFSKVVLRGARTGDAESASFEEKSLRAHQDRSKGKNGLPKSAVSSSSASPPPPPPPLPPPIEYDVLQKEVDDLLIEGSERLDDPKDTSVFKAIVENVRYARGIVDGLAAAANQVFRREEIAATSKREELASDSVDPIAAKLALRESDLLLEWRYAIAYEIERARLRLDSIVAAARSDLVFLLETMRGTFRRIYDNIVDRYQRETNSVNEMANVFCFAIEEARPLEKEMLLDDDRFVVRSNVFVMDAKASRTVVAKEADSGWRFRVGQLARLVEVFRRIAPYGDASERSLVYVLQDLASHGPEEGESVSLPCHWYRLRSADISSLVADLFESADRVDWREFVIYALDLPMPNFQQILIARDRFRVQDPNLEEVVTRARFLRTPLWFHDSTETFDDVYDLLADDFRRNVDDLYEEELCGLLRDGSSEARAKESEIFEPSISRERPERALRSILAKELLSRVYATGKCSVNYTALLLAFCKHADPRVGFAKALALALGSRVCTEFEEGERYVEKLLERRRREPLETTREIVDCSTDKLDETIEGRSYAGTPEEADVRDERSSTSEETEREGSSFAMAPEGFERPTMDRESIVHWLPLDVCLTVLAAALPRHVLESDLLSTSRNLRDNFTSLYRELSDDELGGKRNVVLVHRLLNHDFMKRFLRSTSKFTSKSIGDTIENILRAKDKAAKVG